MHLLIYFQRSKNMSENEKVSLSFGETVVDARRTVTAAGDVKFNISKPDEEKIMEQTYHVDMSIVKKWQKASADMAIAMQRVLVDDIVKHPSLATRSITSGLGDYSTEIEVVPHRVKQASVPHNGTYASQYGYTSVTTKRIISNLKADSETQIAIATEMEKAVAHLTKNAVKEKEAAYKAKQAA